MFGSKLRSWMEAVRSRKKQHRKEKQSKCNQEPILKCSVKGDSSAKNFEHYKRHEHNGQAGSSRFSSQCHPGTSDITGNREHSRYSANNLSSPESAYSTGYSTDGNSPGAPPESLLNTSKLSGGCCSSDSVVHPVQSPNCSRVRLTGPPSKLLAPNNVAASSSSSNYPPKLTPILKVRQFEEQRVVPQSAIIVENVVTPGSPLIGMTSPRQRNRIRTNPWVSNSTLSLSPVKQTTVPSKLSVESPRLQRLQSPSVSRRKSLSSSSCSSFSATSAQQEPPRPLSISDEDFTLNEMMGKYDESYIYEKETDILSDSDPTDCETDIDTGQDGGDEDDTFEGDLDFIDNGSFAEFDMKIDQNTGHCSYYNYDLQKKRASRKRTIRRSKRCSERGERKRKSCSNKKRLFQKSVEREKKRVEFVDGSKSVGATPLSVRRAHSRPVSKLALEETLRKRCNSIGVYRDNISTIDKRDKEADMKYRELITEADHLLRTMKINGLSPRRVPGPANKRVELLRTTECAKPEIFAKNRVQLLEDNMVNNTFSKIPSNVIPNCPRFSPKKNHITKFIISNSPIMVKKEWDMQHNLYKSPVSQRKIIENALVKEKNIVYKNNNKSSPRFRRKYSRTHIDGSSSESDDESIRKRCVKEQVCPQSEPVRRKMYFGQSQKMNDQQNIIGFDMAKNTPDGFRRSNEIVTNNSTENLRQQILMNTLVSIKRNLEDHSASLKQVYRSSHNLYV